MPELGELVAKAVDGRRCLDHVRQIGFYDRSLGSHGYHEAATYVRGQLDRMRLATSVLTWPMDGSPTPWNWSVPHAWEPKSAIFRVVSPEARTLVNFATTPTCLHPWSASTPETGVTADVVYVGRGLSDDDYAGKDVRGKIVLADCGANWLLYVHAIERRGALGYISDDILEVPGVKSREQFPDMVLWYTFYEREMSTSGPIRGWGLSISPRMGDYLRDLLRNGPVTAHCNVQARTFAGVMENVIGTFNGAAGHEEFLCMAHLDHYRPGAMDNASGCAVLLEAADVLHRLVESGSLPRPRRSIRFLFGPEGHVSNVYPHSLDGDIDRIVGSWTVDTVGAKPHVVGGPLVFARSSAATPTFLNDLGVRVLKDSCRWYRGIGDGAPASDDVPAGLVDLKRDASPFKLEVAPYGIYSDNSCIAGWGVPAVGVVQWPSTIWHTQYDTPDRLDPEELARCAWATACASYMVAAADANEAMVMMHDVAGASIGRLTTVGQRARQELVGAATAQQASIVERRRDELGYQATRDGDAIASCLSLVRHVDADTRARLESAHRRLADDLNHRAAIETVAVEEVSQLLPAVPPPSGTGDDPTPPDRLQRRPRRVRPGLINMKYQAIAFGPDYAARDPEFMDRFAELMNLSDGRRTIDEIARIVGHELGPISPTLVDEMLHSLADAGFVSIDT